MTTPVSTDNTGRREAMLAKPQILASIRGAVEARAEERRAAGKSPGAAAEVMAA